MQVDTPDSVLQSGLGLTDLGQHAILRSMVDPRDYDRLRYLQLNGGTPNSFEETIYKVGMIGVHLKLVNISLSDFKAGLCIYTLLV